MKNWRVVYYDKNNKIIKSFIINNRTEHSAENEAMADMPDNCDDWSLMELKF
jgi:hypothetical protein